MQNNRNEKRSVKNIVICILTGLVIVGVAFLISAGSDMKNAYKTLDSITTYVKEQCNRYALISLSSESKSLTRLLQGCKTIEEELSYKSSSATEDDLKEYAKSNYLTGIILLDEKGSVVSEYSKDKNTDYLADDYFKNDSLLETAQYPQKQYAVRYACDNGDEVDIAAICRTDAPGIIVAYYHTLNEYKESFSLNVKALLDGFTVENSTTIVISDGESIIASNNDDLVGEDPDKIEIINKIHNEGMNKRVVAAREDSSAMQHSYGLMKQGRDVFVYSFIPEREIYKKTPVVVIIALIVYLLSLGILVYAKSRASQEHRKEQLKLKEEYARSLEEKNMELRKALERESKANEAKSNFLSRMSHDIRTPINGIVGLIKISRDHFADKKFVIGNFDKMQVAADHLLSLINDVLQMSKIEDNTIKLTREVVDFREMSNEINVIIAEKAVENDISLDFEKGKTQEYPKVYGSPVHLRQIFLNIYTNSIKYNHPGGKITTTADVISEGDGRCTYQWIIEDTGIGMNEEFLEHLFEPFTQEKDDARTYYHGVGLGMSIVKGLLEEMDGRISVSSKEGVGTTFVITIPFEIAYEKEKSKEETSAGTMDISGLHLLLAEDNELNWEIARTVLDDEGAKVTVVTDGKQAVELFEAEPEGTFDAILMDVMMPVMDGLTATKKIRELDRPEAKTIPIIAMTANAFEEDKKKCLDAGMSAHLAKPLDVEEVKRTICEYIEHM